MEKKYQVVFLMTTSGTLMSIILGILFFGKVVFVYRSPAFQFILFGLIFSLLIAIVKTYSLRTYILWSALILVFIPFSTNSIQKLNFQFIIRDILMGICITASTLIVSFIVLKKFVNHNAYIEALIWIIGIVFPYLLSSLFLVMIFQPVHYSSGIIMQLKIGTLIGIGVSSGVMIYQIIRKDNSKSTKGYV